MVSVLGSYLLYRLSRRWVLAAHHFDAGTESLIKRIAPEPPPMRNALQFGFLLTFGLCGVLSLGGVVYGFLHPEKFVPHLVDTRWERINQPSRENDSRESAVGDSRSPMLAGPAMVPSTRHAHIRLIPWSLLKFTFFLFAFFFILGLSASWAAVPMVVGYSHLLKSLYYRRYWKLISAARSGQEKSVSSRGSLQLSQSIIKEWLRMGGPGIASFTTDDGVAKRVMVAASVLESGTTEGFVVWLPRTRLFPWRAEGLFVPADAWTF